MGMAENELEPILDIETRSIRGRACPVCGGKIIPSNTAVFQGQGDPSALYVSWQCERCGHLEVFEKPVGATAVKHGKPAGAAVARAVGSGTTAVDNVGKPTSLITSNSAPADLPPDVKKLLEIMGNKGGPNQG